MSQNVIYVPSLMSEYKTGLIFALIEGLKIGKSIKLVCDSKPDDFDALLSESGVSNITWKIKESDSGFWELALSKQSDINSEHVGCCGMCGGSASSEG